MTTAEQLREAARLLRAWARDARTDPWGPGAAAAFGPDLAAWLDFEANLIDRVPRSEMRGRTEAALKVAADILASGGAA